MVFDDKVPAAAQKALLAGMDVQRGGRSFYQIRALGGAVAELPISATAFPHRDSALDIQVGMWVCWVGGGGGGRGG